MPIVPLFLFKLSLSLAVVWGFYRVALRRLTFHNLNRWYLLGYSLFSFIIPLIDIGRVLPDGPAGEPVILQFIPAMGGVGRGVGGAAASVSGSGALSVWGVSLWVLAAGSSLMLARLIVRWVSLFRLRRNATLIEGDGVRIYQVDGPVAPFSFGNAIFINRHLHPEREWADIILHEYVHVRQRHTIDILIAELICVVNWYNPAAWLIRYSIRQNLEFIADQQVLEKGVERAAYQYHLLNVVGQPRYRLANKFNFSSLRKRIIMMNQLRSTRVHLLKLLLLLPLIGVSLLAFRRSNEPLAGVKVEDRVSGLHRNAPERGTPKDTVPRGRDSVAPLFIVDGKKMPPGWKVAAVPAKMVVAVNVIGPQDAAAAYGERARHGAILVTTKDPGHDWSNEGQPLFVIDGRVVPKDSLQSLNPARIEAIQVLKDSIAERSYGEKGKNGVVIIHLKDSIAKPKAPVTEN
jgi:hypothetical protein